MDGKKQWLVAVIAIPIILILFLGTVDISKFLESPRLANNSEDLQSPMNPDNSKKTLAFQGSVGKLDPSMVEGYSQDPENIIPASGRESIRNEEEEQSENRENLYPYSIMLGSFRKKQNADQIITECREKGYSGYRVKVDLGRKGIWFRVFTGYFATIEEAQDFIHEKHIEKATPMKTRYANLVGVYKSENALDDQIDKITAYGYTPYVVKAHPGEARLYVGAFLKKREADSEASQLISSGIACQVVER